MPFDRPRKITPAQAAAIRRLDGRESQRSIAKRFGISQSAVSLIQSGKIHGAEGSPGRRAEPPPHWRLHLLAMILTDRFTVPDLGRLLGVSSTSVRKGLADLRAAGFAVPTPKAGGGEGSIVRCLNHACKPVPEASDPPARQA